MDSRGMGTLILSLISMKPRSRFVLKSGYPISIPTSAKHTTAVYAPTHNNTHIYVRRQCRWWEGHAAGCVAGRAALCCACGPLLLPLHTQSHFPLPTPFTTYLLSPQACLMDAGWGQLAIGRSSSPSQWSCTNWAVPPGQKAIGLPKGHASPQLHQSTEELQPIYCV